jgi:hypothetical protein
MLQCARLVRFYKPPVVPITVGLDERFAFTRTRSTRMIGSTLDISVMFGVMRLLC